MSTKKDYLIFIIVALLVWASGSHASAQVNNTPLYNSSVGTAIVVQKTDRDLLFTDQKGNPFSYRAPRGAEVWLESGNSLAIIGAKGELGAGGDVRALLQVQVRF
ncbi:MAG: hypothetical protein AAB388_02080 [Patescibacteria group bacterium]